MAHYGVSSAIVVVGEKRYRLTFPNNVSLAEAIRYLFRLESTSTRIQLLTVYCRMSQQEAASDLRRGVHHLKKIYARDKSTFRKVALAPKKSRTTISRRTLIRQGARQMKAKTAEALRTAGTLLM